MKTKLATILLATILGSSGSVSAFAATVVGSYNKTDVTDEDLDKQYRPILDSQPDTKGKKVADLPKDTQEVLIKGFINTKLIEEEAKKMKLDSTAEFEAKLKAARTQILQQEFIESLIKNKITDKMVEEESKKKLAEMKGKKEFKSSHILVETKEEAEKLKKEIDGAKDKNAKFAELAKTNSKDTGSNSSGGDLGFVPQGTFVPELDSKLAAMKIGEIAIVKTAFGWHVVKLFEVRDAQIPTIDQVKPTVRNELARKIIEEKLQAMAKEANVKINVGGESKDGKK